MDNNATVINLVEHKASTAQKVPIIVLRLDTSGRTKEEFLELVESKVDAAFNKEVSKYRDIMNKTNDSRDIFKCIMADWKAGSEKSKMLRQFRYQVDLIYN